MSPIKRNRKNPAIPAATKRKYLAELASVKTQLKRKGLSVEQYAALEKKVKDLQHYTYL
jgi:hypothetical protein